MRCIKYGFILTCFLSLIAAGTVRSQNSAAEKEILTSMDIASDAWNKGNLDGYMALYDSTATMMTGNGRMGVDSMRAMYRRKYFYGNTPKQILSYDRYQLDWLNADYALLTGRFTLAATATLPKRTGSFSLLLVRRGKNWKILHDHSS